MKKIIMIAIVLISCTQLFAQNNKDNYKYNKEGLSQQDINIREAYIQSELNKKPEVVAHVEKSANVLATPTEVKVDVLVNPTAPAKKLLSAPVVAPKTDGKSQIDNATSSGSPINR